MIPEWNEMSLPRRMVEALVAPIGWGVVCGLLLVVSAPLYILATLAAIIGGIGGGAQHETLREAMLRATAGGTLFGLSILLGYALTGGEDAKVHMPDPQILLLTVTLLPAYPLHWLGWRLAAKRRARLAEPTA